MNGMNYKLQNLAYCLNGLLQHSPFIGADIIENNLFTENKLPNICFYDYENEFFCNIVLVDTEEKKQMVRPSEEFMIKGHYMAIENVIFDMRDGEDLTRVGIEAIFKSKIFNKFCK